MCQLIEALARPSFVLFPFFSIIVQSLFRKVHLTVDHLYMKNIH